MILASCLEWGSGMVIVITVCKIIGIVFLALVAILAAVLFIPISYEADADIDRQRYYVRVNWLFHLVRFRFSYDEKAKMTLSVFFVKLDFLDKEKKKRRKKRKAEKKRSEEDTEEEQSLITKVSGLAGAVIHVFSMIREYDLIDAVWPGLQIFLFRIRPRQLRGQLGFGFADPATTGQVVGVLSLLPFVYQTDLHIAPDFETEETYISGNARIRGRLMLIHAVVLLLRLILQKNVRLFIGALRKNTAK